MGWHALFTCSTDTQAQTRTCSSSYATRQEGYATLTHLHVALHAAILYSLHLEFYDRHNSVYLVGNVKHRFSSFWINARPSQRQKQDCSCYEAAPLWGNILQLSADRPTSKSVIFNGPLMTSVRQLGSKTRLILPTSRRAGDCVACSSRSGL